MSLLPDAAALALLVSRVTDTMCGTTFAPGDPVARGESLCGQMVMIPLMGERNISVVVSSDARGSRALGAAFFHCDESALTQPMVDDSIAELLNMVAGQIISGLNLDMAIGLPRRTTLSEIIGFGGPGIEDAALLRSAGRIDLWLWILETTGSPSDDAAPPRPASGGVIRSLLRRIVPLRPAR